MTSRPSTAAPILVVLAIVLALIDAWSFTANGLFSELHFGQENSLFRDLGAWVVEDAQSVPEPGTFTLLGVGALLFFGVGKLRLIAGRNPHC